MRSLYTLTTTGLIIFTLIFTGCNNTADRNEQAQEHGTGELTDQQKTQNEGTVTLKVESTNELGKYLVDKNGRSVYLFKADSKEESNCYDACADAWPPLTTASTPETGEGVNKGLISTFERKDGKMQVAYNGWPLYYYIKDEGAQQRTGQDVKGFGAEWYLISPEGKEVHAEGHHE
ncbi:MAG: COG4315 family predicted lipoprotein [Candidatus Cyclobacteriaceae bacterium M2_1C_046]